MSEKHYLQLTQIFEKYYNLNKISGILSWDTQVNMPKNGFTLRQKQQILLDDLTNQIICDSDTKKLIDDCDFSKLSDLEKRNFSLMKNLILHKTAIPKKLQQAFTKIALKTEFIWEDAKKNNDFKIFNKDFKKLVSLLREISQIKSEALNLTPYETLLDQYDPGRKEKDLDKLFNKLEKELPPLIDSAIAKQQKSDIFPQRNYDILKQKELGLAVIKKLGISNSWCKTNESSHPFCSAEPGDARITTRYDQENFIWALMGFIHEAGHAFYDNNRPIKTMLQPIGQDAGMALHESQSLFFEMQVARSSSFCKFLAPKVCKAFDLNNKICNQETLFNKLNFVEKSYIRVDADELTYPLHIILRYEIEKKLINNEIQTDDLPEIWNEKLKSLLGLKAPQVSKGVLQDIHWSDGSFGYFPTYSLGAIYAAQIAQKIKELITDYEKLIAKGDFKDIISCLKNNIHLKASTKNADTIIEDFCGNSLDADIFISYLKEKYAFKEGNGL